MSKCPYIESHKSPCIYLYAQGIIDIRLTIILCSDLVVHIHTLVHFMETVVYTVIISFDRGHAATEFSVRYQGQKYLFGAVFTHSKLRTNAISSPCLSRTFLLHAAVIEAPL